MAAPTAIAPSEAGTTSKSTFQFATAHFWGDSGSGSDFSVPSTFTERLAVEHRRELGPVAFVSATGFGLNRGNGDLWRPRPLRGADSRGGADEESLFVQESSIEIHPARAFELSFSTQFARQVAFTGVRRQEFSFGATATVMPTSETTIYVGVDRGFDLQRSGASNIVSAGIDAKIPGTPVSLNADCWTVLGPLSETQNGDAPASGVSGAISWQINDRLWSSLGIEWDTSSEFAAHCTEWRYYFSLALWASADVTFALDLSYAILASDGLSTASRERLSETRIRLSRRTQLAENFATEISLEWATGTLVAENESDRPALRFAGKFDF